MARAREENGSRSAERLALGLGLFSIGLGLAEVGAPRALARFIGIRRDENTDSVVRAFGAREIANGVAILAQPNSAKWVWSRVGGDLLDLSSLRSALRSDEVDRGRLGAAAAAVLGVTVLDVICAGQLSRGTSGSTRRSSQIRVEEVATINRSIDEVYEFWRNFSNLPRFMRNLESVDIIDDRRSHWRVKAPGGTTVEWEAEIVQDVRNEWIAWRSLEGADVPNSGSVRFQRAPGARGTEVRVQMQYSPPGGRVGRGIAWLFGKSAEQQVHEDLHRFKQLMETGEVPISDGFGLSRPARPAADPNEIRDLVGVHS